VCPGRFLGLRGREQASSGLDEAFLFEAGEGSSGVHNGLGSHLGAGMVVGDRVYWGSVQLLPR